MSLLSTVKSIALDVGIEIPDAVVGSTSREMQEMLAFANVVGTEIARRADWGDLTKSTTVTFTDADVSVSIAVDLMKLTEGAAVIAGNTILRPLSRPEWPVYNAASSTPRYYILEGQNMRVWPRPVSGSIDVTVRYQSLNWVDSGAAFTSDGQLPAFPEEVFHLGLNAYWRKQKSMPYSDQEGAYEAAIAAHAGFDIRT